MSTSSYDHGDMRGTGADFSLGGTGAPWPRGPAPEPLVLVWDSSRSQVARLYCLWALCGEGSVAAPRAVSTGSRGPAAGPSPDSPKSLSMWGELLEGGRSSILVALGFW